MNIQNHETRNQPVRLSENADRNYVLIAFYLVIPVVLLFYALGSFRTFGSHEVFAAVPAQEMVHSGDWTVPRYAGIPRLKKPPLGYWVIAATASLTGMEVNELTSRIPAALAAILLACLIGYWGYKWYGKRAGYAAGFIQATSVYVIIFGRKAEVDMILCLLTTSALFLVAESETTESRKSRFIRWSCIYAILSLAWLAKFHYGLAIVMGPTVIYLFIQKRFRDFFCLLNPIGLLLLAAAALIWPYMVVQQLPHAHEIWLDETVGRALGTKGEDPIWYYLPYLCWMPLPWSLFVLQGAFQSFQEAWRNRNPRERFLWVWFFTVLVIVSVQPVKHGHYLMGCLPAFSLFAARPVVRILDLFKRETPLLRSWQTIASAICFVLAGVSVALLIPVSWPMLEAPAMILGVITAVGGMAVTLLLSSGRPIRGLYVWMSCMLAGFIVAYGWIMPVRDHRAQTALYAREVRNSLPEGELVHSYELGKDSILYYLDTPVNRIETSESLKEHLESQDEIMLVAHRYSLYELKKLGSIRHLHSFQVNRKYAFPKDTDWVFIELKKPGSVQISQNEEESVQ